MRDFDVDADMRDRSESADAMERWHEAHPESMAARRRARTAEINAWAAFVAFVTNT